MPRRIHLHPLRVDELARRYRAATEPHKRRRWQILWLLARRQTAVQIAVRIAASTGSTAAWIGRIARRYNDGRLEGMTNRHHAVRVPWQFVMCSGAQQHLIAERISLWRQWRHW
jgi:hypothetical protein